MENLVKCPHCDNQQEARYMRCLKCQWEMDEKLPSLKGDTKTKICSKCGKLIIFSQRRSIGPTKEIFFCENCGVYTGTDKPSDMIFAGSCETIIFCILSVGSFGFTLGKEMEMWQALFIGFFIVSFLDGIRRIISGFKLRRELSKNRLT